MDEARRNLLRLGVLTAASAALPVDALAQRLQTSASGAASAGPTDADYQALSNLTANDFKPFVGATFKVTQASGTTRVTLAEVQSPPALATTKIAVTPSPQTYALRFKNVAGPLLKQGTYVFDNSALGPFAMFIVPSAAKAQPMYYTGHVNRSVQ